MLQVEELLSIRKLDFPANFVLPPSNLLDDYMQSPIQTDGSVRYYLIDFPGEYLQLFVL